MARDNSWIEDSMPRLTDAATAFGLPVDDLLRVWYDSELIRATGVGYDEAQGIREDFLSSFEQWCTSHFLKTKICEEWQYCRRLKEHENRIDLALALAGFISTTIHSEAAASLSAAILIVRHGIGLVCECDD
jgi:hypothetical protein